MSGQSLDNGTTSTDIGDFDSLLLEINPTMATGVYPESWTQYTFTISGLSTPTSGRFAFRYFVTDAGPNGSNSNYIGIDNIVFEDFCHPVYTPSVLSNAEAGQPYSEQISATGSAGTFDYSLNLNALPNGLSIDNNGLISGTPTTPGLNAFTITISDDSLFCEQEIAYEIYVECPADGASLNLPAICVNDSAYTLVEGTPSGGVYSGIGVSNGTFDPAFGTQNITYSYTDSFGCLHEPSSQITVNSQPIVSMFLSPVCNDSSLISLNSATPSGGIYSGTGVSGNSFDPSNGTTLINYTYTDTNGCYAEVSDLLVVNEQSSGVDIQTACNSYTWIDGNTYTSSNSTATQTLTNAVGCDSIVTLNLTINDSNTGVDIQTACNSYTWIDGNTYTASNNTATHTFQTGAGCDSVVTLNLTVLPNTNSAISVTALDFYTSPSGTLYNTSGVYTDIISNAAGCDSIITITLNMEYTGIEELEKAQVNIYPNPTKNVLHIDGLNKLERLKEVKITSVSGMMLKSIGLTDESVDVSELATGVYFVNIIQEDKIVTLRFVKN